MKTDPSNETKGKLSEKQGVNTVRESREEPGQGWSQGKINP